MTVSTLKRSADRKVTNAVSPNGKTAKIANAFGLPSGKLYSCPGATSVCENVCYAGKLEKIYKGVKNVLLHNWELLNGKTTEAMVELLQEMVDAFRADCNKEDARRAKRGIDTRVDRAFRIHWDGDFFSLDYAAAWAWVIAGNTDIQFWVYTRSFVSALNVLPIFGAMADKSNLSLYLSVDSDNMRDAVSARKEFPWARWAYLSQTFADGRDEMANEGVSGKAYNCPENGGRIPLISEKGSACIRCNICPKGRGDVVFSIGKR